MLKKAKTPKAEKLKGENKEGFFSRNIYIILAFLLPFALMTVGFAVYKVAPFGIFATMVESVGYHLGQAFPTLGIEAVPNLAKPWGDRQMLVVDLWHQYHPFLVDLGIHGEVPADFSHQASGVIRIIDIEIVLIADPVDKPSQDSHTC